VTTVAELVPGDLVVGLLGERAVFVCAVAHPIWPGLQLVVWRMMDGWVGRADAPGWSFDALSPHCDVGSAKSVSSEERLSRLRVALLGK
jgi:hypothetical protein